MHGRADERCCCGRRSRVVLTPRRRRQVLRRRSRPDRARTSHIRQDDGDKKARSPGRSRSKAVKTIARGMPGCSGELVVTTSCAILLLHARLRVQRAPGIPCALSFGPNESCTTRAFSRGENAEVCFTFVARLRGCVGNLLVFHPSRRGRRPLLTG